MKFRPLAALALTLCVAGATLVVAPSTSVAGPPISRDASVIVRWNEIADRTFVEAALSAPAASLYFGFTSLAVYDAVVAIEGQYEPWIDQPRAHANASSEAAAATAAYDVLRHYFPTSAEALAADYAASLASIPNGVGKEHGTRVGKAAAAALIAERADDGRGAAIPQPGDGSPGPGDWRPTPPANAPMALPWLGFVDPLLLESATPIALSGPPALDSAQYAAEFAEVRDYGGSTSLRSAEQTATALFWNANPVRQYNAALRDQVTDRGLDIVDSARAFALLDSSTADALIACWRAKYDFNFWRPVTAIALADTDGNDATDLVPGGWTPHVATPPYSDYTSGHACVTGATTGAIEHLFGSSLSPALEVPSLASTASRSYSDTGALDEETMSARIWLGFHFRFAMTDGNVLGHAVADHAAENFFRAAP